MGETGVKTLMIAGGGTGGHIYPAIAIAREYMARDSSRRVVFVGTERGLEKQIVPKAGFPLEFIDVGGLKGKGGADLIRNMLRLPRGFAHPAEQLEVVHQTGPGDLDKVNAAYVGTAFANARVVPYLDPMADEIASADLVVSRAGAMTIGELAASGRAAILIPFAAATNNH